MERLVHPLFVVGHQSALRNEAFETVRDARTTALDRGMIDVVQLHLVPCLERYLGDPRAHRPGADYADDE
jgi:hypothetical protein